MTTQTTGPGGANTAWSSSKPVLSQTWALVVGVVLSIVAVGLAFYSVDLLFRAIGDLIVFVIGAYSVAVVGRVWLTSAYDGGFTKQELLAALFWPVDYARIAWRTRKLQVTNISSATTGSGPTVCSHEQAFIGTIVASVAAAILAVVGFFLALSAFGTLVWLAVFGYIIGVVVQFWLTESWRDGLTRRNLKQLAVWPAGAVALVRAGARRVSSYHNAA